MVANGGIVCTCELGPAVDCSMVALLHSDRSKATMLQSPGARGGPARPGGLPPTAAPHSRTTPPHRRRRPTPRPVAAPR
jgi:hypothetical protein